MSHLTFYGDMFLKQVIEFGFALPENYVFNLEAPLTNAIKGHPGKINLRGRADLFESVFSPLPTAVCLANNHIMDFGEEGFLDTVNFLKKNSIAYFGAGYLDDNCNNPILVNVKGVQVGLMGYVSPDASPVFAGEGSAGCMPIGVARVSQDIELARKEGAERIVVQFHWGAEQVAMPSSGDVKMARSIIDAGADIVIGHHAHCIQAFEIYQGKYIFYGIGNWIFPAHQSPSYYTVGGDPGKIHISHSFEKNKRSLAVSYELTTGKVTVEPCYFDGVQVNRGKFRVRQYYKELKLTQAYEAKFQRAFSWGKLRHTLEGYVASPKLPRLRHVRGIINILKPKHYK